MAGAKPVRPSANAEAHWRDPAAISRVFDVLMDNSEDGVLLFDRDTRVLFMNRACEHLTGKSRREVCANDDTCGNVLGCHDQYGRSLAGQDQCPVRRLFADKSLESLQTEMCLRHADGREVWVENRYFPVSMPDGEVPYVVAILRNVSERKAMEEQLLESRKLASFAVLTAGIAHELKNPLGILRSAAEIVSDTGRNEAERREAAEYIKSETMRLDRIIREFLAYARPNPPELAEADLNEIVDHTLEVFQTREGRVRRTAESVVVEKRLAPGLPACWVDGAQIHQVLLNLLLNAEQAVGESGTILVTTGREGDWLTLEVSDSGPGIAPDQVERVFDPFYTTKPEGSGLGLAVVRRITTEHRGRIRVTASPWGGAAVAVCLPIHPADCPIPVEPDLSPLPIGSGKARAGLRRRRSGKDA